MEPVVIDAAKCVGCGLCAADCVSLHIALEGGAARVRDNACVECGHCFAICPSGAVSMPGYDTSGLEGIRPLSGFDPDDLLLAMASRRSVRQFTPEPVAEADILRILEAGRCCPTGSNRQGVYFTVLREDLPAVEAMAARAFEALPRLSRLAKSGYAAERGQFFFKGAPAVIVVSGKQDTDPALASSYMELMAGALGLGALYSGFFVYAARASEELRALLGLPVGVQPVTALCLGHSAVEYRRRVPRRPLKVTWR